LADVAILFTGEPGSPRRFAAGAVTARTRQDRIGIDDFAKRIEADGPNATTALAHLAVGDINPAAVDGRVTGAAVGQTVPRVAAVLNAFTGARDDTQFATLRIGGG
jgi:hypothetical protein